MTGYLIELLFPTGWRRLGEVYWRLSDAVYSAKRCVASDEAVGFRILTVRVAARPVQEFLLEDGVTQNA